MTIRKTMPRRVPGDIEKRANRMIQIWEKLDANQALGDLSLQAVREKIARWQRAKVDKLATANADNEARIILRTVEDEMHQMSVQTLQLTSVLFGPDSPEYKLAGGTPLSERGKGRNGRKLSAAAPATEDTPKP